LIAIRERIPKRAAKWDESKAKRAETLFTAMAQVRAVLAAWRDDYNAVRPHTKFGGPTPAESAKQALAADAPIELVIPSTIKHLTGGLYL
jgi:putative transposase